MNIKIIHATKDEVEIEFLDEGHTFLNVLKYALPAVIQNNSGRLHRRETLLLQVHVSSIHCRIPHRVSHYQDVER